MKKELRELIEAKARIISENKDDNVMSVSVPFIQSDVKNLNGRIYKKSLLKREIARVQGSVKKGSFVGTGDHPVSGLADIATASHIVTALSLDEKGKGTAELRVLPTPRGKTIQTLIKNNATLGVSIRGFGDVVDGVVSDNYKLVGLDVVLNPSFKGSVFDKSNIFESLSFEEEANENLEKEIQALEKESYLGACESGFKGSQADWEAQYSNSLREAMGLPKAEDGKTSVEKLTEEAIQARTYSYFLEAQAGGFMGDFNAWKEKFPQIVEQASESVKRIEEKKTEPKVPFKSKITWDEVKQSGFSGDMNEWREKYPNIELILPESPKKVVVEKTLTERAGQIFTGLMRDNPKSSLTLEDIIALLEKKEIAAADQRLRKRAIYIVNTSLAGSGSVPSQEMLSRMVEMEIENLKKQREEMRERNWVAYEKLLQ